jgi:hypothetical protein
MGHREMGVAMASLLAMARDVNGKNLILLIFIHVKSHLEIHGETVWGRT